jgi:hypothetical protein
LSPLAMTAGSFALQIDRSLPAPLAVRSLYCVRRHDRWIARDLVGVVLDLVKTEMTI